MASTGPTFHTNREVMERYVEILNGGEIAKLDEVLDPEYVQFTPQSGEVVRGVENLGAILMNYPRGKGRFEGGTVLETHVVEPEPREILNPQFARGPLLGYNLVKIQGDEGDKLTVYARERYPDGSEWFVVVFATFRDHRILEETQFFAPVFDPPEWRAQWVEHTES